MKVGVPKFHVIITHYEVILGIGFEFCMESSKEKSDWFPKGSVVVSEKLKKNIGSTDTIRCSLVQTSDVGLFCFHFKQ